MIGGQPHAIDMQQGLRLDITPPSGNLPVYTMFLGRKVQQVSAISIRSHTQDTKKRRDNRPF